MVDALWVTFKYLTLAFVVISLLLFYGLHKASFLQELTWSVAPVFHFLLKKNLNLLSKHKIDNVWSQGLQTTLLFCVIVTLITAL